MSQLRSVLVFLAFAALIQACATSDGSMADTAAVPASAPDSSAKRPTNSDSDSLVAVADRARILGAPGAPVWVVIISDFQCPFCKVWHDDTYPALKREFVDRGIVRLAYVNLPLPQHQHARITAELALCAGLQGRFWEYQDAVFDTQAEWSALPAGTAYFDSLRVAAPIDRLRLKECVSSGVLRPLVEADFQRGMAAKVRSTPTFIVGNDIRLEGAQPIESFRQAIAAARSGATPGAPR